MNPTWYDILGVRPDASPDAIKVAWRRAADRFDPGAGGGAQFQLFNEAAAVLLDPERRRGYDQELLAATPEDSAPRVANETAMPAEPAEDAAADDTPETSASATSAKAPRRPIGTVRLVVLGALALVLVAAALWIGLPALHTVRSESRYQAAAQQAPAAAERAAPAILSYDFTSLDADRAGALRFMTDRAGKEYADTFDSLVRDNATKLHAKVTAEVSASAVSEASADRANVLVFVNQTTTSKANDGPQVALNRVVFSMVRRDGSWLVDKITAF